MDRLSSIAATVLMLFAIGGCTEPRQPTLSAAEVRECHARGGYPSRGGFGEPFCQFRYSDGGKACRGKADCQGDCLSEPPGNATLDSIPAGTPVAGHCAAERYSFGCFGTVEDGKLVDGYTCAD